MIYIYSFIGLTALALAYMRFEAATLKLNKIKFTKSKKHLKVLQLSDIHIGRLKVSSKKIKKAIEVEKPDIILLTGDYIESSAHIPAFFEFLEDIKGSYDIFACLGNHDYKTFADDPQGLERFISDMENSGVKMLHNCSIPLNKNSKKYNIIGIADKRLGGSDVDKALESCSGTNSINIAFSHNPEIALDLPAGKVDYLFCGHFHGGQIWAPFDIEFKLMRNESICKMGVRRGLHNFNGTNLYVNRGLGCVCFPLRFLSPPEITVYYLP